MPLCALPTVPDEEEEVDSVLRPSTYVRTEQHSIITVRRRCTVISLRVGVRE